MLNEEDLRLIKQIIQMGAQKTSDFSRGVAHNKLEEVADVTLIVLKGRRNEKKQRYYIINLTNEQLNMFWHCLATHIKPPKQQQT